MNQYHQFQPELIVEATSVCDRKCAGCYAPNLTTNQDTYALFQTRPELFLQNDKMASTLGTIFAIERGIDTASVRGGEPSKHPQLPRLLRTLSWFAHTIYLETHGHWILSDNEETQSLLESCRQNRVIVKISFDKMHGLSEEDLVVIALKLMNEGIRMVVAITETSLEEFKQSRLRCDWLEDRLVIFQKKAFSADELIQPKFGVIHANGTWSKRLATKLSLASQTKEAAI